MAGKSNASGALTSMAMTHKDATAAFGGKMVTGVSESVIAEEILNAESSEPPRYALYIATTAKRDAAVQKTVREISAKRRGQGKFSVGILF
jgi:hypothetical protein